MKILASNLCLLVTLRLSNSTQVRLSHSVCLFLTEMLALSLARILKLRLQAQKLVIPFPFLYRHTNVNTPKTRRRLLLPECHLPSQLRTLKRHQSSHHRPSNANPSDNGENVVKNPLPPSLPPSSTSSSSPAPLYSPARVRNAMSKIHTIPSYPCLPRY